VEGHKRPGIKSLSHFTQGTGSLNVENIIKPWPVGGEIFLIFRAEKIQPDKKLLFL
jgi:hypothetical protein